MGMITRVGIVGMGHVGAHVANSLLLQGVADEIYVTEQCTGADDHTAKLRAEVQDLRDSLAFCPHNVAIFDCGDDYGRLAACDVIVNAAGNVTLSATDRDGELFYTTETAKKFILPLAAAGFDGRWVNVSNPCDVVATEIWKLSGCDPRRVLGTGTALDSSRFKNVLSQTTGIDQHSITAYMLGEHGASMFAAWSAVAFGGKPLAQLRDEQPDRFRFDRNVLEEAARRGGYVTYAGKQCTEYAVADAAVRLVRAIVSNEHVIMPCSTLMTGGETTYGEEGFFTSLPCVIGADGVEEIVHLDLTASEEEQFHASCAHVKANARRVGLA
ncbi:lactate/malate family dehydrogenase [Bifidobacterium choloepi]|uniref:L-lactate dehydrogenase n=1 Tax=Bifidobacterium choloepi TaxID=2614131 RepID=A0A6I5NKT5_9BIFI|nr:L-lactate dehydrogenase [Bifidobacterium choloepi]NEG69452.1 L-lactate dehydrogenase [Bifidobacterium choloepi]